ncbi:helix-turn-helix transcriptional regulator, partial [Klebsiella pneumoniae]
MKIGSRIRQLRLAKNIKIAELAEAVGVDAANISRLETGKQKQFSEQTLNRLAQALSVSVPDLFTSDENDTTVHISSEKYASPVKDVD